MLRVFYSFQYLPAVASWIKAYMYPLITKLIDDLIERLFQFNNFVQQIFVAIFKVFNVRCVPGKVLAPWLLRQWMYLSGDTGIHCSHESDTSIHLLRAEES